MSALLHLVALDARLAWRGRLPHVVAIVALGLGLLVRLALPERFEAGAALIVADATEGAVLTPWLDAHAPEGARRVAAEDLAAQVEAEATAVGVALEGSREAPRARLLLQGGEGPSAQAILATSAEGLWVAAGALDRPPAHTLTRLGPEAPPLPFNRGMVPVLLAMDAIFLGALFAAAMVFEERGQGTLGAWRVSPVTPLAWTASKLLVNAGLALLYTAVVLAVVGPGDADVVGLMALVGVSAAAMSAGGLIIACFFENLSAALYPMAAASVVLSVPIAVYMVPGVVVDAAAWLPTWPVIFGFRELMFPSGRGGALSRALLPFAPWFLTLVGLAVLAVQRRLMQEVS